MLVLNKRPEHAGHEAYVQMRSMLLVCFTVATDNGTFQAGLGICMLLFSLICLGSTVFARLIIALTNWPQVETGTVVRSTLETGYIATKGPHRPR